MAERLSDITAAYLRVEFPDSGHSEPIGRRGFGLGRHRYSLPRFYTRTYQPRRETKSENKPSGVI